MLSCDAWKMHMVLPCLSSSASTQSLQRRLLRCNTWLCPCRGAWPLCDAEAVRPFDFLVSGELLRQTLEELLLAKDLSAVRQPPVHASIFTGLLWLNNSMIWAPCQRTRCWIRTAKSWGKALAF